MAISVFDLFRIGIGPSSSHTVGPMRAAGRFLQELERLGLLARVGGVRVELFGSLGATGVGHGSDRAVILGLCGERPETVDPERIGERLRRCRQEGRLALAGEHPIRFHPDRDLLFHPDVSLPHHANGMILTALDGTGRELYRNTYYSIGGGFVVDGKEAAEDRLHPGDNTRLPCPFATMDDILEHCRGSGLPISGIMLRNERAWRDEATIRRRLLAIWETMQACIRAGCRHEGTLPGGLGVVRRAPALWRRLEDPEEGGRPDPLRALDRVTLSAIAVNEENAAGGRVVTAPTNGAAGIVPAVLRHYLESVPGADDDGVIRFLLTAGAIGILCKQNASISGAEVGCQGEVGSACSMAAAGLTEVMGGDPAQVENAAEIAMEHNLGLTCDPVRGLVQVPCIERNGMAAVKAINASRMALNGDGSHFVSLDRVIATMRDTGRDMQSKYKETAQGGLAVNVTEC